MKQAENSYISFKKDFEEDYKKHKFTFKAIIAVFAIFVIGIIFYLFWGMQGINNNNKDWEVKKFMWSTQSALEDYYQQNKSFPDDIRNIKIKYYTDSFKVVSSNEIEYMGYKINYSEIDNNQDYKLETYFVGPRDKGKFILYKDTK
jgi:type II secretory pathway pseudopilin PulG